MPLDLMTSLVMKGATGAAVTSKAATYIPLLQRFAKGLAG